ncbi:DUF2827 domain-containing protein [Paraburkholderia ferrariae]|uniref:DUF2827 domain-containing protein n=1 Tax=Paraburkholderia ferrariae TaxID=386056 RepID=UPI00047FAB1A|nr:DUF2827 domain-containing protein [Paraburkholderia ferrariae]
MRALKQGVTIGITIGLHAEGETMWNNGIKQNAVYLALALAQCPGVARVMLVNTTAVPVTPTLPWDQQVLPTLQFDVAKDQVDVLIELGGQIDAAATDYLKRRGARLVSYCCGSEYILAMEAVLFRKQMWGSSLFVNQRYDDIWMIPQIEVNRAYLEVFRRQQARVVPFVWSPIFMTSRLKEFPHIPAGGEYRPHTGPRRLSVLEPNINIVKFCLYPVLIAELAFRQRPGDIERLQVCNALQLAHESPEFVSLMNQLDIVRQHKAVFTGRHETPLFMAENTDIVISHQLENPLNYLYLEVCWQGYPLVHNASLCPDLGYYYENSDVEAGARRLIEALTTHDSQAGWYRERQRTRIARHLPDHPQVVATYAALLDDLLRRPIR